MSKEYTPIPLIQKSASQNHTLMPYTYIYEKAKQISNKKILSKIQAGVGKRGML